MDVSQICLCFPVGWYSTVAAVSGKQTQYVCSRWVGGTAPNVGARCTIHQEDCGPQGPPRRACCLAPLLLTHQTFVPVINTHIRNAGKYCRSKQKMNRITGRKQHFLLCSRGGKVQKNETKWNYNLQKLQSRNIKELFPQTTFICSIWSHWPLLSTHQELLYLRPTSSLLLNLVTGLYSLISVNQSLFSMFRLGNASIPMSYKTNSVAVYMHLKRHPGEHSYGFHLLHHFPPEGLP